jgi:hypothetical protein
MNPNWQSLKNSWHCCHSWHCCQVIWYDHHQPLGSLGQLVEKSFPSQHPDKPGPQGPHLSSTAGQLANESATLEKKTNTKNEHATWHHTCKIKTHCDVIETRSVARVSSLSTWQPESQTLLDIPTRLPTPERRAR